MLSKALCNEIETFCEELIASNPMFTQTSQGRLSPQAVNAYLENIRFLISHTPPYLERARSRAERLNRPALVSFFQSKLGEEQGHDEWAKSDLGQLKEKFQVKSSLVCPQMERLVEYLGSTIDSDPALYLPYILMAEYVTVLVGPSWLAQLESRCGIPRSMLSVVGNHAELDRDHVSEFLDTIDSLVNAKAYRKIFLRVLADCMEMYWEFAREIGEKTF